MAFAPRYLRTLLIPATIALAVVAGIAAAAATWRTSAPAMALRISPHDAVASMVSVERRLASAEEPTKLLRDAAPLGRDALRREPLNPRAIRLLAMVAEVEGKRSATLDLLALSQRVSRRDLGTHLALIEHYSGTENVDATLNQYDLALSTSGPAGDTLLPILTSALAEPEIRQKLAVYVHADRPWLRGFLVYAIANAEQPENVAMLLALAGGLPKHPDYREFETQLLDRLIASKKYAAAHDFFLTLPGASGAMLKTVDFTLPTTNRAFGPMAWYLSDQPEASAQVGEDGNLWVRAAPGKSGTAAQRILYLPHGSYVFRQTAEFAQDAGSAVWELRCMRTSGATMIWHRPVPPTRTATVVSAQIDIPPDCPVQMLTLGAAGEDSQQEAEITFSGISMRSANR
ncbi:MAG: hypothetical protein EON59_00860 [Alphaproteobacteria bacterium]|nr:MAG: hypothetical protein EON59_00860 [Alphaproteobacteria bacterium]